MHENNWIYLIIFVDSMLKYTNVNLISIAHNILTIFANENCKARYEIIIIVQILFFFLTMTVEYCSKITTEKENLAKYYNDLHHIF